MKKKVLLVGLHPSVVDYAKYPGLTPERLIVSLEAERAGVEALGHEAVLAFIERPDTGAEDLAGTLDRMPVDCVLIGAGVRGNPEHFLLFERLVNAVHRHAPAARICFNTGPTDSLDAVRRWI